jgi:hypothetical protein
MNLLAGYQKSGTEWIKFVLTNLFAGERGSWGEYDEALPNHPRRESVSGWIKTHEPTMSDGFDRALYLVRHPLDVCISSYRYRAVIHDGGSPMSVMSDRDRIRGYVDRFIENRGDDSFNRMNRANWIDHVSGWLEVGIPRAAVVRHESLRNASAMTLGAALATMGIDQGILTPDIRLAFSRASERRMRSLDRRHFLGRVEVGQWRDYFDAGQAREAEKVFGPIASRFGYDFELYDEKKGSPKAPSLPTPSRV